MSTETLAGGIAEHFETPERRELRATVRRFVEREVVPHLSYWERAGALPRSLHVRAAELGLLGIGITEPDGGSDVAGLRTTAVRDGDHYVVNGAKTYITSGTRADFVTTAVRTGGPGHGGISLLVVEAGTPGFTVTRRLEKMGRHCSDTAELSFADVRVPVGNLVGTEGTGFVQIAQQFQYERTASPCRPARPRSAASTSPWTGCGSGRPSAARSWPGRPCATPWSRCARGPSWPGRSPGTWRCGCTAAPRTSAGCASPRTPLVPQQTSSSTRAVQLHGGMGCMREAEVERHYRDARILSIGGGASEVMTDLAAKRWGW